MKKITAILLLSIHLYNLGGYTAVYQYFIYQSNKFNEAQISRNLYNPADLVEIKIPVKLNITSWTSYEPISGTVQLRESWYNYVKLKLTADTMYVMCVPNYTTTHLINANVIYAKEVSDAPFNAKKQTSQIKNIAFSKYVPLTASINLPVTTSEMQQVHPSFIAGLITSTYVVLAQPPELAAC